MVGPTLPALHSGRRPRFEVTHGDPPDDRTDINQEQACTDPGRDRARHCRACSGMISADIPEREWLTLAEAAAWFGLSPSTIRRAKNAGRLRAKKTANRGGKDLYRVAELRSWADQLEDA